MSDDRGWLWWGWHYYAVGCMMTGIGVPLALSEGLWFWSIFLALSCIVTGGLAIAAFRKGIS